MATVRVLAIGSVYPPHHLGGYEVIWRGAMRHLRAEGHEARILVTDYRRADVGAGQEEALDVHRELQWYWRGHEWRSLTLRQRVLLERHNALVFDRHVRDFRPDVISWWPVGGISLGLIERAVGAGLPSIFFVLDPWPLYGPRVDQWLRTWARSRPLAAVAERITGLPARVELADAGRFVFCSRAMREETAAAGVVVRNGTILTPGVERAFVDHPREPELPQWRWRLLYAGRVVEQKGIETAIRSLPLLPTEARLRIVGEGDRPYRERLELLASELGVADRVTLENHRPRDRLIELYRQADAVVFPVQWSEPWGLVPLEAMALGRPVVATGRGGSGEYLADGSNSLLFEAGDAAGLASALRTLAGDSNLRARLIAGGYETAAEHTEDVFNRRALEEMLGASKAPRRLP
jgi:glycosyltransferase involved in cell wall biosynthesis